MDIKKYSTLSIESLAQEFRISLDQGLSNEAITLIRQKFGFNELKTQDIHWWNILLNQCMSPFLLLLVACAVLSFLTNSPLDGLVVLAILGINTLLGFYQEYAAYRTIYFLKKFTEPTVRVRRNGHENVILARELVPGDIIFVEAGDIIPADIRFVEVHNIMVDEAALTGESIPVQKKSDPLKQAPETPSQAINCGFAGTTILSGSANGIVCDTGENTELGAISKLTMQATHLGVFQKDIASFSKFMMYLIVGTLIFVVAINLIVKKGTEKPLDLLLFALALALGITPEALPVIATFALARGARQLAKNKVVVKRLSSIDDLGSVEILCTDKTGTLTENILSVDEIYKNADQDPVTYATKAVAALSTKEHHKIDALDEALNNYANSKNYALPKTQYIVEFPFDPQRRHAGILVKDGDAYELIVRGMYDAVIERCIASDYSKQQAWNSERGNQGKRVIAVAVKKITDPRVFDLEKDERDLTFVGLIAYADPVKPGAAKALVDAEKLGIKIKILSGDAPEVVGYVSQAIGLIDSQDKVMTGQQFNELSEEQQQKAVLVHDVFARVSPRDKYTIISLLQKTQFNIGFLGDGMNDAPALKIANVGMVVQNATESARDAADIILLKKSLKVIVDGIRQGRVVYKNTLKYVLIILASNFSNFYSIAIVSLFMDFLPLLPVQILLSNLLTDIAMVMIATDNVDESELKEPTKFIASSLIIQATVLGTITSLCDVVFLLIFRHEAPEYFRTNWFIVNVITEVMIIFSLRTRLFFACARRPSLPLVLASIVTVFVGVGLTLTSWGQKLFGFVYPRASDIWILMLLIPAYFIGTEIVKLLYNWATGYSYNQRHKNVKKIGA